MSEPAAVAKATMFPRFGSDLKSKALLGAVIVLAILYPILDSNASHVSSAADAGVFVLLALGLNIVVGYAGLLDLGYAAFFAIGSYAYGFLASPRFGIHLAFWLMLPIAGIIAAIFGIILGAPTLRLRGDYLAIVTLGFGEIVPVIFLNADKYTNGPNGINALDPPVVGSYNFGHNPLPYYFVVLFLIALIVIIIRRLRDSPLGRAWMAIREDEVAAAAMGIDTVKTKLFAFAIGASFSGIGGVVYSSKLGLVTPDNFRFSTSAFILSMVVLGGMGNIPGVILGAVILFELQSLILTQMTIWSHQLGAFTHIGFLDQLDFVNLKFLLYGLALVLMMLFRPEGLLPSARRRMELHATPEVAASESQELYDVSTEAQSA
ncbi:MAG TPA: ABC transporter ATP-binding protein [Chloroflexota bacterium]|nr:ABC transporter ATP-binding protein [Chloroflexota bacterium]